MSVQPPPFPGDPNWLEGQPQMRQGPEIAGLGRRLVGSMIDAFLFSAPFLVFVLLQLRTAEIRRTTPAYYVLLFGIWFLNDFVLTATTGGSVGKHVLGMRVVLASDFSPVGAGPAFMRWAVRVLLGFIPIVGLIDPLFIFSGELRQTLHDRAAGTIVIRASAV